MSQTTDGEHIYSKSPPPALWLNWRSKSSKRRSASSQRRGGVNGAAAHWLILARSSGSESELSAVRFSTYSFVGGIHEWTLRSRHASLRRTGHRRNRSSPNLELSSLWFFNQTFQNTTICWMAQVYAAGDSWRRRQHVDATSQISDVRKKNSVCHPMTAHGIDDEKERKFSAYLAAAR